MTFLTWIGVLNIVLWLAFGAVAGWVASIIVGKNSQMGLGANVLFGVVGAIIGGFLASLLGIGGITGFNIGSFLIAVAGAVVVLLIVNSVKRHAT